MTPAPCPDAPYVASNRRVDEVREVGPDGIARIVATHRAQTVAAENRLLRWMRDVAREGRAGTVELVRREGPIVGPLLNEPPRETLIQRITYTPDREETSR